VNTSLEAAECSRLFEALEWRFRLFELGNLQLVSNERKERGRIIKNFTDEAVSKLSVHYKWLLKWTVPKLQVMVESDKAL
jgi:hypothetical protein